MDSLEKQAIISTIAKKGIKEGVKGLGKSLGPALKGGAKGASSATKSTGKAKVGPFGLFDAAFIGMAGGSGMASGMKLQKAASLEKKANVKRGAQKVWETLGKASGGTAKHTGRAMESTGKFLQSSKGKYVPPVAIGGALAAPSVSRFAKKKYREHKIKNKPSNSAYYYY